MTKQNDERVLDLKEILEKKKKEIKQIKPFNPKTKCILNWHNVSYNLNVLSIEDLQILLCELSSLQMVATNTYNNTMDYCTCILIEQLTLDGELVVDWIDDISNKLKVHDINKRKKQIIELEKQLNRLLSTDKQTELQLDAITKLLK